MEDEDLELLRIAALKTLQSKKTTQNQEKVGNAIKVNLLVNSVPTTNVPYFPTGSRIQTLVNDNSTINDPFIKHHHHQQQPQQPQPICEGVR